MERIRQLNNLCGIDVGCTNIKMTAIVNNRVVQKTVPSGDDCTKHTLVKEISDFYASLNYQLDGLGIALSGCTIDGQNVCRTSLQCLDDLSTSDFAHLDCKKINLINDANAVCLAGLLEYPSSKVLVAITNGTGIGAGIAINGQLFTGAYGFAGEIFGIPTVNNVDNQVTKIGRICSGSKILKKIQLNTHSYDETIMDAANYLGITIVSLIQILNPDTIYLAGGGFKFENFLSYVKEFVKNNSYPYFLDGLHITETSFSLYAGCFGAMKSLL